MKVLENINSYLASLVAIVSAIFLFLSDAIKPPTLPANFPEVLSNFEGITKFVIGAVLLIMLYPLNKYSVKEYKSKWWIISIITFLLAIIALFIYYNINSRYIVYDQYSDSNYIIGTDYTPYAQMAVDSLIKKDPHLLLSAKYLISTLGEPEEIWREEGILENARNYFLLYSFTIMLFVLFLISSLQASFSLTKTLSNENDKK